MVRELELRQSVDRNHFKFVWLSEHHALTEYSHLSASELFAGDLAATTERIHIGSGIFNVSPRVNHPVRNAERVASLTIRPTGASNSGTGRGAGSHEVGTFNIHNPSSTRAEYDDVIREFRSHVGAARLHLPGKSFLRRHAAERAAKALLSGHPPIWVACGNPATFEKAGALGIGALGFTFDSTEVMKERSASYKEAIAACTDPVGQFKNDNIMMSSMVYCAETGAAAREQAMRFGARYVVGLVALYHDTFPTLTAPRLAPPTRPDDRRAGRGGHRQRRSAVRQPRRSVRAAGEKDTSWLDQLVFATCLELSAEERLAMIELIGQKVIPEFDPDPAISTDRYRAGARPKFGPYAKEPPPLHTIWTDPQGR